MKYKESTDLLVVSEGISESRVTSLTRHNGVCRLLSREFTRSQGVGVVGYLRNYSLLYWIHSSSLKNTFVLMYTFKSKRWLLSMSKMLIFRHVISVAQVVLVAAFCYVTVKNVRFNFFFLVNFEDFSICFHSFVSSKHGHYHPTENSLQSLPLKCAVTRSERSLFETVCRNPVYSHQPPWHENRLQLLRLSSSRSRRKYRETKGLTCKETNHLHK